eukprot:jgi/Mesen1/2746/ME000169S01908
MAVSALLNPAASLCLLPLPLIRNSSSVSTSSTKSRGSCQGVRVTASSESASWTAASPANKRSTGDLKGALRAAVADTNRGKNVSSREQQAINQLVLVKEILDEYAGAEEGPFLSRVKPLALGRVRQTGSFQVIDTRQGKAENVAEFSAFGVKGILTIYAKAEKVPSPSSQQSVRLDVTFESFNLKFALLNVTIPLGWVNPKGWVDVTFLDEEFRISRGDKGSVFIAAKLTA